MADDKNFSEDEYQFSDVEGGETYTAESVAAASSVSSQQMVRKRIIIGIGVIVVVLAVYKLLGVFFAPKTIKKQPVPTVVSQPLKPVQRQIQRQEALPTAMTQSVAQLQQQAKDNVNKINALSSRIDEMQTSLNTMNNSLISLNSNLQTLQKQFEEAKKPKIRAVKPIKRRRRVIKRPVKLKVYYIKAIIPGRVWLKTANGATITLSEGMGLPGYGKIINIDAQQGRVKTSSGRMITFSLDEM